MRSRSALLQRTFITFSMAASIAALAVACNNGEDTSGDPEDEATTGVGLDCEPGEELECECPNGDMSTQMCLATGDEAGPCDCGGYGYVGGDTPVSETNDYGLSAGTSGVNVEFGWHDAAGRPAPTDLDITIPGHADPVVQVFSSVDGVPYVRSGLIVKELAVDVTYTATIGQDRVTVKSANGTVLDTVVDFPAFDEVSLTTPEPSIYAAPVVVGTVQEY